MYLTPIGEDTLLLCDGCGYSANRQIATFKREGADREDLLEKEEIETPNMQTIEELAAFLDIPTRETSKAVFMMATTGEGEAQQDRFVLAVIRGDMEVNETKLANAVGAREMWPRQAAEEIAAVGAVSGYGSPLGVEGALVVVDPSVADATNLKQGANRAGFHTRNVNCGRDYTPDITTDIAAAGEGDGCPRCGEPMRTSRGVEVGNIFQLGTKYTDALGGEFLDADGKTQPVIMGSQRHWSWPSVGLRGRRESRRTWLDMADIDCSLPGVDYALSQGEGEAQTTAEAMYHQLREQGLDVLLDDRRENPGVKFNDADLIGIPVRLTVGDRGLKKGVVEFKLRRDSERSEVPVDEAVERAIGAVRQLEGELSDRIVEMPYSE